MRFPLSTTPSELVDLCGQDTYRVYALDELGEVLDFVTTLQAARPRNANVADVPSASSLRVSRMGTWRNEIYVVDDGADSVSVWPTTASGDVAPTRRLAGTATKLSAPWAVWIDPP